MIDKYKNIILIIFTVIIAGLLWYFYFGYTDKVNSQELLIPQGNINKIVGDDLILLLLELRIIDLDSSIFDEKTFLNLKDFSTEITPRSIGRKNPFSTVFFGGVE